MDSAQYLLKRTRGEERSCTVYREADGGSYDNSVTEVGTTALWLFDASATSSIDVEGAADDASFTAFCRPAVDRDTTIRVGDEIQFDAHPDRRYVVRTKVGVPTELSPTVWRLGVDRANA